MRRALSLSVLSAAVLLTLAGPAFAAADVTINDDGLDPETVKVDVREDIIWTNATDEAVSLVGEGPQWESGPIEPGATFSIKITQKGTYTYSSEDGSLSGEIVVGQVGGGGGGNGGNTNVDDTGNEGGANESNEGGSGEKVNPDDEPLPITGIGVTVPGLLSLLLIAFGGGLLVVTQPAGRRARA